MKDTRQSVWWRMDLDIHRPDMYIVTPYRDLFFALRPMHSQFGEDTAMDRILSAIGPKHRTCFECGAGDGYNISNTLIFRRYGWPGYLVEADADQFARLNEWKLPLDVVRHDTITRDNVNDIMYEMGCPQDLDVFSLDIDSDDFGVFHAMTRRPRIVCVERAHNADNKAPENIGDPQAGYSALMDLMFFKGYVPVALTPCNVIGVRGDAWNS